MLDRGRQDRDRTHALASIARLQALPRAGLGSWPTPLEQHAGLDGMPLWIKRDDRSGLGRGGGKARKIDLVIGHMLAHGYDELITVAGNVTNLAFDVLPALERFGLRASLFIADDPPLALRERERIFSGIGARIRLIGGARSSAATMASAAWLRARAAGRRPLLLLPGAAHPAAVFGNALGFLELVAQFEAAREPLPSALLVTAATGTTLAGFVLGEALSRASGRAAVNILGVQAYGGATRAQTRALLRWSERALGIATPTPAARVQIDDTQLAGGFGRYTKAQAALCQRVADRVGVAIDPIFGGKTWSVLEARASTFCGTAPALRGGAGARDGRAPLFWHCGFTPEWALLGAACMKEPS